MSEKIWSDDAWEDYLYWQTQDKKTLKRINQLIQDIERNGCMKGMGKPDRYPLFYPKFHYSWIHKENLLFDSIRKYTIRTGGKA